MSPEPTDVTLAPDAIEIAAGSAYTLPKSEVDMFGWDIKRKVECLNVKGFFTES